MVTVDAASGRGIGRGHCLAVGEWSPLPGALSRFRQAVVFLGEGVRCFDAESPDLAGQYRSYQRKNYSRL